MRKARHERPSDRDPQRSTPGPCGGAPPGGAAPAPAAGEPVRVIRRAVLASSPVEVAYRALLHGLWRARTTGTRHVRAYVDNAHLAAQLGGSEDVPPELTGLYLQIRALLNAYGWC